MDLRTEPSVTLYAEDCALLEPFLRHFERTSQARGTTDDEAALRIYAIRQLAARWLGSANGTAELPELDMSPDDLHDERTTVKEAAKTLGISERGVRLACEAGRLEARKVGGVWQVDVVSVVAYKTRREARKVA
ncbi:MAG TPA: helix-turn-helix domain-containing protein [Acidimicrobiales bacterium]|nr:helix-turn-helix domain-containing protein [Acidimicrobiales bacterium]